MVNRGLYRSWSIGRDLKSEGTLLARAEVLTTLHLHEDEFWMFEDQVLIEGS